MANKSNVECVKVEGVVSDSGYKYRSAAERYALRFVNGSLVEYVAKDGTPRWMVCIAKQHSAGSNDTKCDFLTTEWHGHCKIDGGKLIIGRKVRYDGGESV